MYYEDITPEYVNELEGPTENFLCPLSANIYKIDFTAFKIRSLDTEQENVLFEIRKEAGDDDGEFPYDDADDGVRTIRYHFGPGFLEYQTIGTTLEFSVGDQPLHNFRMIERHYFKQALVKSYDFTLPFVIPNTTNTWEVIYTMPDLFQEEKVELISNPWETRSDSFYFVDGRLAMHNKAEYNYSPM